MDRKRSPPDGSDSDRYAFPATLPSSFTRVPWVPGRDRDRRIDRGSEFPSLTASLPSLLEPYCRPILPRPSIAFMYLGFFSKPRGLPFLVGGATFSGLGGGAVSTIFGFVASLHATNK